MSRFEIPPPPVRPDAPPLWVAAAVPVVGSLGTVALVVSGGHRQMLIGVMLAAATLGAMLLQGVASGAARRSHIRTLRSRFRQDLTAAGIRLLTPPGPSDLIVVVGTSEQRSEFIRVDDDPRADPVCIAARDRFLAAYATLPEAPHLLDLASVRRVPADVGHARAVILAAAEACPPEALSIEVRTVDPEAWAWVALLPHHGRTATHRLVVHDRVPPVADSQGTTRIDVVGSSAATYSPSVCGPAAAATRARLLGAATTESESASAAWTVTLGTGPDGQVRIDLRESADGGVGPHGLLIGATGSGKSELLRQCLAELIHTHPADELHLALIDYKGGAAFHPFRDVPHTTAYVTNLADSGEAHRLRDALEGELLRRQRALAAAGAASVREHPMPRLMVVVDEFAELLAAEPDITDLFARVGRLGRSLGIHLLLSTQRLEEGRLQGLEAHLSYRIALRTFTTAESRIAIGSPMAAGLPLRPGSGVLAAGGLLQPFQAPDPQRRTAGPDIVRIVGLREPTSDRPTVFAHRVGQARGTPAPRLWLPPLEAPPALDSLAPGPPMTATIGVVDRPRDRRIDPLTLDLTGTGGHVAIVGGPRSGTSTALRTLACALRRSTPGVRLLGLDLTGGLAGVLPPQRLATGRTPERIERLLRHLRRTIDAGAEPPLVVLVDSWSAIRENYAWADSLHQIAERGLAADVHLAVAAHRWSDLRPAVRDLFGSRVELRLGDPLESEIDRRLAAAVPASPGRGLISPGYAIQLALDSQV